MSDAARPADAEPVEINTGEPDVSGRPAERPRASSMDSTNLPERSTHEMADRRRLRRRRSVAQIPTVVEPMDAPDDAEGRVEFIVVRAAGDRDEPPEEAAQPVRAATEAAPSILSLGSGWVAVAVLACLLIIAFLVFSAVFR